MKKKLSLFLLALIVVSAGTAFASNTQVDGIWYNFNTSTRTASITFRGDLATSYSNEYTGSVVIPASVTYNGVSYSVTSIGNYAFFSCSSLSSIKIPNSVTSIGKNAFQNCSGLTSIEIPNSVTSIGGEAFYGCSGLTSVVWRTMNCTDFSYYNNAPFYGIRSQITSFVFGNEVVRIPAYLCYGMNNLISVTIPNSVTSIGGSAFQNCTGLTSVEVPNSVTSIGSSAFYNCSGLHSVTIGNSVTSIGGSAFQNCTGLTSVEVPNSVTSIGNYVFNGCSGVTSVTIGNNVTTIGDYAFQNCTALASIEISNSVTSVGYQAFSSCSSLTSVTIGNSVTSIGNKAFYGCSGLTNIVWNTKNYADVSIYSSSPFYDICSNITSFTFGVEVEHVPAFLCYGMKNLTSVSILNNITSIGANAFQNCTGFTSIEIPNSVTSVGNYAFNGCSGVTSVTIGNNVTTIGDYAFQNCTALASIEIPNSVTSVGNYAFNGCSSVTAVSIGNNVSTIGDYVFAGCSGLVSIEIPNSVTSVGNYAFNGCSGLASVTIGNNVSNIGDYVFAGCSGLVSIEIPNSVTSVGNYAFNGCSGLASVTIGNNVSNIGDYAFNFSKVWPDYTSIIFKNETPCTLGESPFPSRYKLYIPCGSLNTYKAVWSNYTTYELPTHVKTSITPQYSGYISIPDSASECRSYTIKAISYDHWHFIGWSDGINDSIREVDGAIDTTLTAIFEKDRHSVEITTEDSIKGIVTGSGNYEYGDNITIEALPEYGYHFSHWSDKDAEYDSQVPADAISASRASRLASYLDEEKSSDEKYTIIGYIVGAYGYYNNSYRLSDTPNGSGDFIIFKAKNTATTGSLVKVNAYLYNYYGTYETLQNTAEITEITQNALDNPRKVHITRDTTFTAYFESNKYTITVTGGDEGWYYGGGEYDYLSSCTIYAEAGYGYSFTQWSDGNTDNPRVVVLTQDTTFTAQYEYITSGTCGNNYVLTWSYDRENTTLTISGNGALDEHYTFGVEAPRNMTKLVIEDGVTNIGSTAFDYCYSLTSVMIPNSVTSIGSSAFEGCRSLTSVTIPNSVTNIGQSAFEGCRSLTSVEIPSSVTNVGIRAFANCPLEKVYWGVADQVDYAKEEFSSVGIKVGLDASNLNWSSVYLYAWTNSGTTISSAWPGTKVNIDESGLYTYTFSSSYSTINIIWNNGTDQTMDITNVSTSGIYTLTSSSGTNISYNTRPFEGKSLSSFVNSTANISEFTIGENVTRIPALLCEGAGNLTELTIPNSVTAIGESAFDGCSALTKLTLGENITSYGTNAFAGCSNLASIYNYRERPAKLGANTFDGVDYFNCTLYVLANSVNMYKSSGSDWKDFYFVEPIGATSATTDEVVVTPYDNTADVVWPTVSGANSYELTIKDMNGDPICTLIFNANGQLTSLAFHAPARNNAPQQAQTAGFQFTITGLEIATRYTYTMQVKDASSQVIAEYSGTFGTTGATEIPTGINNISTTNVSQKIMSNDQIYILRGEKVYTITGQEVK